MRRLVLVAVLLLSALVVEAAPVGGPATTLPGFQTGDAPWRRGTEYLRERLHAIGLPALKYEGTVLHIHQHLDIFVLGRHIVVPTGVGIAEDESYIAPIHTHDQTGVLHVESDDVQAFTVGQFFDIWGVRLSATCLGGHCVDDEHSLKIYVDGSEIAGDARAIELKRHQEIAIVYARRGAPPVKVPWIYNFPAEL